MIIDVFEDYDSPTVLEQTFRLVIVTECKAATGDTSINYGHVFVSQLLLLRSNCLLMGWEKQQKRC